MVSNGGAGSPPPGHFDCVMDSFEAITGARTGKFEIEFEEVTCGITSPPVIINWADKNAFYCKMMFENLGHWGSLEAVELCIDGNDCGKLERFAGQTWTGCPKGVGSMAVWKLTQKSPKDGSTEEIRCSCTMSWPMEAGERCTCNENFGR
jgi:hypothetical protein